MIWLSMFVYSQTVWSMKQEPVPSNMIQCAVLMEKPMTPNVSSASRTGMLHKLHKCTCILQCMLGIFTILIFEACAMVHDCKICFNKVLLCIFTFLLLMSWTSVSLQTTEEACESGKQRVVLSLTGCGVQWHTHTHTATVTTFNKFWNGICLVVFRILHWT